MTRRHRTDAVFDRLAARTPTTQDLSDPALAALAALAHELDLLAPARPLLPRAAGVASRAAPSYRSWLLAGAAASVVGAAGIVLLTPPAAEPDVAGVLASVDEGLDALEAETTSEAELLLRVGEQLRELEVLVSAAPVPVRSTLAEQEHRLQERYEQAARPTATSLPTPTTDPRPTPTTAPAPTGSPRPTRSPDSSRPAPGDRGGFASDEPQPVRDGDPDRPRDGSRSSAVQGPDEPDRSDRR